MNIYLAAPWRDKEVAREAGRKLISAGHTITEPWWDHTDVNGLDEFADELRRQAYADLRGVGGADVFVLLNTGKSEGKAVELGYALACKEATGFPDILLVGKRGEHSSNVFHFLDEVNLFPSVEAVIDYLEQ